MPIDGVRRSSHGLATCRAVLTLLALLGAGGATSLAAEKPAASPPPNFVFILIDDMGWRDLGCCGSTFYETPHIDRLAARGMRFTQAYAACPVCSPSRASILTGKYPARLHLTDYVGGVAPRNARLRVPDWKPYLDPAEATLPQLLKSAGYVSGCIGKWHLGGNQLSSDAAELRRFSPLNHGFDVSVAAGPAGQPPDYYFPYRRHVAGKEIGLSPPLPGGHSGEYLTDHLTEAAEHFLERHRDRPFFLYFPHYAVHTAIGDRLQGKPAKVERYRAKVRPGDPQKDPVYAAMIESVDESVARIVRKLEDLKLAGRTFIIFTSDNGGYDRATSNLPLRGSKSTAYEGGTRVPLIVAGPGVPRGSLCDTPVTGTDYLPTLLDLAGVGAAKAPSADGESLLPLLRQSGGLRRDAIYWHYPHYNGKTTPFGSVRQGDFKLIEFYEDPRLELYNLGEDPGEANNLAAKLPEKTRELQRLLASWRKQVAAQMPTAMEAK